MTNTENKTVESAPPKVKRGGHTGGNKMGVGQKPKNFKSTLKKLVAYMKPYMPAVIISLILITIATVFNIIGPEFVRRITNEIFEPLMILKEGGSASINLKKIGSIAIFLVCIYIASAVLNYIQGYIMATISQRMAKKMRTEISEKINRIPLKYFDSTNHGNIMSRVSNDVDMIGQTLSQSVAGLVACIIMLIGSLVMMFVTNWLMALTAIGATIVGFALMTLIIAKSQKYFVAQQAELGKLNGHIEEVYGGHNVVKAYNNEKNATKVFKKINTDLKKNAWVSQFMSGIMMPLMGFVGNLGFVSVCIVGAVLVHKGKVEFGVISAFMIYIRLFTNPLSQLAQIMSSVQSAAASGERVFELLEEKEMEDESHKKDKFENVKGDVKFKNVKFGYDEDKLIIKGFSAHAKPGQKVAIVGPTGAGKTTMVNLLMRFYEVGEGQILIDDKDISTVSREEVRKQFCMVLQDTWLFEGTIRENIIYNTKGITEEQLVAACKAAGVDHYIRTLPEGYDTILSDNANLSAGQKQLMTIARAMLENSPMLILDEATSSVDTRTEILIQNAMDKLMAGRTSFVIAHRLSTIKNADLILVMKEGDIVEQGNHKELITQNGFYASLYNSQFE